MRVLAVQMWGHPGFGDLEVDFSDRDGRAARLVVVAGENGCGKTAILEAIFNAFAPNALLLNTQRKLAPGRYRVLIETDEQNRSTRFNGAIAPETFDEVRSRWPSFNGIGVEMDGNSVRSGRPYHRYFRMSDNTATRGEHESVDVLGSAFGCFYSEANVSFDVPKVQTIGTSAGTPQTAGVHPNIIFPVRGGISLAGEVAQLLVDLKAADDSELAQWVDANKGTCPPDEVIRRRIKRFTEAYARVAPKKRYVGIETADGEHRAMFEENGLRTALADLSTGEKQIVFRGAFLLRRAENLAGAVVLIDEPELSLHPKWQENIVPYYDKIVAETPEKSSQVIVATHSPFIMHGSPTAKHVVLRRSSENNIVVADRSPTFRGVSATDVAVAAFDLADFVRDARGKQLALIVEGPTDRLIIEEAWRKLRPHLTMPFTIRSADGAKNIPRLLGAGGGKSGPLLEALSDAGTELVGLLDFDAEGHAQWKGTISEADSEPVEFFPRECQPRKRAGSPIWVALLPVPEFRRSYASLELANESRLTIELLFQDNYVERFLERMPVAGDGSPKRLTAKTSAQKKAVADAVAYMPPEAFVAFEPIFGLLEKIGEYGPAAGT
nr:AAA family ATPase [uncultured Rhodopila sp.]